jgi:hypothetical protein
MLSSCEAKLVPFHNAEEIGGLQRDVSQRETERERGSYNRRWGRRRGIGRAGREGKVLFLSLIRTVPLAVGSVCYTAEKSVAIACACFCFVNLRAYELFFLFTTRLYERPRERVRKQAVV